MKYLKYALAALLGFSTTHLDLDPNTVALLEKLLKIEDLPKITSPVDQTVEPAWATNLFLQMKQENIALRDTVRSSCGAGFVNE